MPAYKQAILLRDMHDTPNTIREQHHPVHPWKLLRPGHPSFRIIAPVIAWTLKSGTPLGGALHPLHPLEVFEGHRDWHAKGMTPPIKRAAWMKNGPKSRLKNLGGSKKTDLVSIDY